MKYKNILFVISVLCFCSCEEQNNLVIQVLKQRAFTSLEGKSCSLSGLTFDDWAYPDLAAMQALFPGDEEKWQLAYEMEKYHGVKIIIEDWENAPYEYDPSDGSYYYEEPDKYKFIAFFPRNNGRLVRLFKKLYVSKDSFRLSGRFTFLLPAAVWTGVQIKEDDMPVMMIKTVNWL